MQMRTVWVLLVAAAFVPSANASTDDLEVGFFNPFAPSDATMYVHLVDKQDAPINTQPPADGFYSAPAIGLVQHSQGCYENPTGSLMSEPHHTTYAFSSPSYVEYSYDEGGKPRIHNERGISYDVELEPGSEVMFRWYLETQYTTGDNNPDLNQLPGVVPNVVVRATLREGDDISVGSTAYNEGELIAQGQSDPAHIIGPVTNDHPHVTYEQYGDRHLYNFEFPLKIDRHTIRATEAYNLRVDVFMENPACNDVSSGEYIMPDFVRTHTSDGHRPSFDWSIMNPLRIEMLHPQMVGDEVVVHAGVNSVWGNYDVGGDSMDTVAHPKLVINGNSIPVNLAVTVPIGDFHDHGPTTHIDPTMAVWSWPTIAEHARDGIYSVELEITNDQTSATAFARSAFALGDGRMTDSTICDDVGCRADDIPTEAPGEESPGIGIALVGALLAVALLRRK